MADLWSDYTDGMITEIDNSIKGKYKMSVRDFLTDPMKYATQPNVDATANNMWEDSNKYIDTTLSTMGDLRDKLDKDAMKANGVTSQLSQNISLQAKQNKVPIIKPLLLYRDNARDEIIYVDNVDPGIIALVEKLVGSSKYVADASVKYEDYTIGEWYFSSDKQYVIRAYLPPNEIISLETARDELKTLFDAARATIKR